MGNGKGSEEGKLGKGEAGNITDGAFNGLSGFVEEVDSEKGKLKVMIEMFGRETIAELITTKSTKAKKSGTGSFSPERNLGNRAD